jgi:hypothetical protein
MHTFFHGWRRKIGGVTLVMALALMGAWIRGQYIDDIFGYSLFGHRHVISSSTDRFHFYQWNEANLEMAVANQHLPTIQWGETPNPLDFPGMMKWFLYAEVTRAVVAAPDQIWSCEVPYWSSVLPLTLLSAYLILWQPRKQVNRDA